MPMNDNTILMIKLRLAGKALTPTTILEPVKFRENSSIIMSLKNDNYDNE